MVIRNMGNEICQSCGKTIRKPEDFGTNKDGSKNSDYCVYCFKSGNLTNPHLTMEQMIDIAGILMAKFMDISEKEGKEKAKITIPGLKRWHDRA